MDVSASHSRRFFRRWWVWCSLIVLLVAAPVLARWILTRPAVLASIAESALSNVLGGEVTINGAAWLGDGSVELTGVVLSIDGVPDAQTTLASVEHLSVQLDLWAAVIGDQGVESIRARGGQLNLLESQDRPEWINLANLHPAWARTPQEGPTTLGTVELIDVHVTLGLLTEDGVVDRGARSVDGWLRKAESSGERWAFELIGSDGHQGRSGEPWTLTGEVIPEEGMVTAHVEAIDIDEELRAMLPIALVRRWAAMNPSGRVASIDLAWKIGAAPMLVVELDHAALTLPVEGSDIWARFHDGDVLRAISQPHLVLDSGSLVFDGDRVHLRGVVGSVAGPPESGTPLTFELEFTAGGIEGWRWDHRSQWAAELASAAPFTLSLRTDSFEVTSGPHGVDIPVIVAEVLEIFPVAQATLSTEVTIERGSPQIDAAGRPVPEETTFHGRVLIDDARGYLAEFPYPLEDVSAYVEFSEDRVEIIRATGRGPRFGSASVTGTIAPPTMEAGIDLRVELVDVRLDEEFRRALSGVTGSIYDEIFNVEAWQEIDFTDAERTGVVMELGGFIDATLDISRPPGTDGVTTYLGRFNFDRLGMVWSGFAYPLLLGPGVIHLHEDGVTLGDPDGDRAGITLTTITGARGEATGSFSFNDAGDSMVCDLGVAVADDRVNPQLLQALAQVLVEHGHGTVGHGVEHLTANGLLAYEGQVTTRGEDAIEATFAVAFDDGELLADATAMETLLPSVPAFMTDVVLEDLRGHLTLTTSGIEIQDVTGEVAGGTFAMAGDPSRQAGAIWRGRVTIDEPLLEMLEPLASDEDLSMLRAWQVRGDVAIEAHLLLEEEEITIGRLVIDPERLTIVQGGMEIEVTGRGGDLLITTEGAQVRSLAIGIGQPGAPADLHLVLEGTLAGGGGGGELDMSGHGRLIAPAVIAVVGETVGQALSAISFEDGDGTIIESARWRLGTGEDSDDEFFARLMLRGASMDVGVGISEIDGIFSLTSGSGRSGPSFQMRAVTDSIEVLGTTIEDLVADVVLVDHGRRVDVEVTHGSLAGGDVIATASSAIGDRGHWTFHGAVAGADVVELVADQPQPPGGRIVAAIDLAGVRGEPSSQRGRGAMRIMGGKIADVPAALALLQVLQLTTPFINPLDYADIRFFIEGDEAVLESIVLESSLGQAVPLQLLGEGRLSLDDMMVDVRFRSRSGWIALRDVIGALGDQLFALHLHGPLKDPEVDVVPLPGLHRSSL